MKKNFNPFSVYCAALIVILVFYNFDWCSFYPEMKLTLLLFFFLNILFFLLLWRVVNVGKLITYRNIREFSFNPKKIQLAILIAFGIDIYYAGYIPLLSLNIDYYDFGAPVVDIILMSFLIFYTVFLFHNFLSKHRYIYLFYFFFNIILIILLFRRAALVWIFLSSIFITYQKYNILKFKNIITAIAITSILFFSFGFFGNLRSGLLSDHIIKFMGATDKYINSNLPNELYPAYIYSTSPIANLQNTIDNRNEGTIFNFIDFSIHLIIPDTFSKRIISIFNLTKNVNNDLIHEMLTASTIYAKAYTLMGYWGMLLIVIYIVVFIFVVILSNPPTTTFHVTANALLCTLTVFCLFSNMVNMISTLLIFTYPLIYRVFITYKVKFIFKG